MAAERRGLSRVRRLTCQACRRRPARLISVVINDSAWVLPERRFTTNRLPLAALDETKQCSISEQIGLKIVQALGWNGGWPTWPQLQNAIVVLGLSVLGLLRLQ